MFDILCLTSRQHQDSLKWETNRGHYGGKAMRAQKPKYSGKLNYLQLLTQPFLDEAILHYYEFNLHHYMGKQKKLLNQLGIFGFDHLEPDILASQVTDDPLLLIGLWGKGKPG